MLMQAPEGPHPPASRRSDYSQAVILGAIMLLGLWLAMFLVGGFILSGSVPAVGFGLVDFQFVPIVALALWLLLAGVLLWLRPTAVRNLAQRLARLSSRASTPQAAAVWCWYASACCLILGLLLALTNSGHPLSGLGFALVFSAVILGLALAREVVLRQLRRH
jgi:hypothetical protein